MRSNLGFAVRLGAVALIVSSCSSNPEPAQVDRKSGEASTAQHEAESAAGEAVSAYFRAYATQDPVKMEKAMELAAPGSVAAAYLAHQTALANANLDAGEPGEPMRVEEADGEYELCGTTGKRDSCTAYADIEAKGNKIANFTVRGRRLDKRLLVGSGERRALGSLGSVELLSAYHSASNALFVVLRVNAAVDGIAIESRTAYRAPDGRQKQPSDTTGPTSLLKDAIGYYALYFPLVGLGGDLHLEMYAELGGTPSGVVDIPLR